MGDGLIAPLFTITLLAAGVVVAWLTFKYLAGLARRDSGSSKIMLLHTRALSTRSRLLVVGYRGREYVLGVSGEHIRLIDTLNPEDSGKKILPEQEAGRPTAETSARTSRDSIDGRDEKDSTDRSNSGRPQGA